MINKVKLINNTIPVKYKELDKTYGLWSCDNNEITLNNTITVQQQKCTLLHEIIHAIDSRSILNEMSEVQTDQYANGFFYFLQNNKIIFPEYKKIKKVNLINRIIKVTFEEIKTYVTMNKKESKFIFADDIETHLWIKRFYEAVLVAMVSHNHYVRPMKKSKIDIFVENFIFFLKNNKSLVEWICTKED